MKKLMLLCGVCAALLLCALPVCAENEGETPVPTTTTTTTAAPTTTTAAPTTTTAAPTTTTVVQTTTAATTQGTTGAPVTTTTQGATQVATVAPTTSGATTTAGVTTTVTTVTTTAPVIVDPTLVERTVLVTEPGMSDNTVYYFNGENQMKHENMVWVGGRNGGQALELGGTNEYLRFSNTQTRELTAFTFSGWVYWRGGAAGQKLLTVYKNDNLFFTVSPNMQDTARGVDGFYLEVRDRTIEPQMVYHAAAAGQNTRLETEAWHHLAVVVTGNAFKLYVDGAEYLTATFDIDIKSMGLNYFKIGGGFHNEPTLNALLDDAYLYPRELTAAHIALLAADMDPAAGGTAPTKPPYTPTRPTTVSNKKPVEDHTPSRPTIFGIPLLMVLIPVAILIAVVALSLVFTVQKKNAEAEAEAQADEPRPVLGEPETPFDVEEDEIDEVDEPDNEDAQVVEPEEEQE